MINNGTINAEVTDGLLVMDANLLNNGHINVGHGDTIDLIGTVTGQRAARLINSMDNNGGQIAIGGTVAGGILNATVSGYGGTLSGVRVQGTLSLDSPSFDVGYLYGLTVTGATSFAGSGGAGPATIDLSNGTTLTFDGSNAINDSVINMDGSSLITADAGSSATTLTLGRHSVVNIGLNESVLGPASDTTADQIINDGIINVTGPTGSTLVLDVSHFTSNGQINLASGDSIILQGSSTSNFGTISGDAATALINDVHNTGGSFGIDAVIVGGTLSGAFAEQSSYGTLAQLAFEGSIVIGGGGQIGVEAGMTFSGAQGVGRAAVSVGEGSELYGVGAATIDNAAINLGSASYGNEAGLGQRDLISGNTATPGILTLGSATTVTQTNTYAFIYAGGQAGDGLINEGTIDATYAGGTLSVATASSFTNDGTFTIGAETAAFSVVGTFTNNAALTFGSGSSITFTSSTLTNAAAGSLALAASAGATTSLSGDKYSMITNDGTLAASGSGTVAVAAATVNAGMITAGNGTLQFLADLTNDGTITVTGGIVQVGTLLAGNGTVDIGAGASASLLAGAASTQTVDFTSSTGELVIKASLAFLAGIAGFGSNDVIQLTKTAETGYSFGNGALTITDGTSIVASLTFAGSYTQQDFSVTENAHGNTIITHT